MDIIQRVEQRLINGERLTTADAVELYKCSDLLSIGQLANKINIQKNSNRVFYNINRHINPTNICVLSCKFCAYSRKPNDAGAYSYTIEQMIEKAQEAYIQGATEVHLVGGLHPRWNFTRYVTMVKEIKKALPALHIKAFTVVELNWMAKKERKTIKEILIILKDAGLGSLPGGGAEIFHPKVREKICENKVTGEMWLETHKLAHSLGLKTNCTMLYGHIESYEHRVDHMDKLRTLQDQTHGFNAFIPLSFQPDGNEMGIKKYTYGYDDLKNIAIARLFLDNFDHIKSYWVMLGQDIAQIALKFGANDLDGTVVDEKISNMAGGQSGKSMLIDDICKIIIKTKSIPVERDTLYNVIKSNEPKEQFEFDLTVDSLQKTKNLLHKYEYEKSLSVTEYTELASKAELYDLSFLARKKLDESNKQIDKGTFASAIYISASELHSVKKVVQKIRTIRGAYEAEQHLIPNIICIYLSPISKTSLITKATEVEDLLAVISACNQSFPAMDIVLKGLKGLWEIAQSGNVQITDLLKTLKSANIATIESADHEYESDLTHTEIVEIHKQVAAADCKSVAKVELISVANGLKEAHWESFITRLAMLSTLATEHHSLIGLTVSVSSDSYITPIEYLRVVSLARLIMPTKVKIVTPIFSIPVLTPLVNVNPLGTPFEKYAALLFSFGANDLGIISEEYNIVRIMKQIRASGFRPIVRDAYFSHDSVNNIQDADFNELNVDKSVNHFPALV